VKLGQVSCWMKHLEGIRDPATLPPNHLLD
jgi:hypothetical protein